MGLSGPQREVEVIAHLDSAMNKWFDAIPDHRTYINSQLFWVAIILRSKMGSAAEERPILQSIGYFACNILCSSNYCSSTVYSLISAGLGSSVPLSCNLHKRCPCTQSHCRHSAAKNAKAPAKPDGVYTYYSCFYPCLIVPLARFVHGGARASPRSLREQAYWAAPQPRERNGRRAKMHECPQDARTAMASCGQVMVCLSPTSARTIFNHKARDVLAELSTVGAISGAPPSGTKRARREEDSADGFTESPDTSSSATESFPPATQRPDPRYAPDYAVRPIHPSHSNYSRATTASHGHETSSHGPTTIGYQRHISAPVDPVYDGLLADIFTTPQLSSLREGEPSAMLHDAAVYDDLVASLYSPLDTTATLHNPPYPPAEHTSMQNPQRHRHSSQGHERTSEHGVQSVHPTYPASDYAEQRMYPDPGQMGRHPDHAPFSTHS